MARLVLIVCLSKLSSKFRFSPIGKVCSLPEQDNSSSIIYGLLQRADEPEQQSAELMFWRRSTWHWTLPSSTAAVPCWLIHMVQYICLQRFGDSVDPHGNRDACGFVSSCLLAKLRWSSCSYLAHSLWLPWFQVTHLCTITKSIVNRLIKLQTFQFTFYWLWQGLNWTVNCNKWK